MSRAGEAARILIPTRARPTKTEPLNLKQALVTALAVGVLLIATGCSSDAAESADSSTSSVVATTATEKPSAASAENAAQRVCVQIEKAGVGTNCVRGEATGLQLAATAVYDFDLPSVPGEGGAVMAFDDAALYRKTVQSYEAAAALAGPHRYGSEPALIFVQINEGLSSSDGRKVQQIVESFSG